MGLYNFDKIFQPVSIAVIGASEKKASIGRALMENLAQSEYPGEVFAVNPNYDRVRGCRAYRKITDIPEAVELARKLGFEVSLSADANEYEMTIDLSERSIQ